jgi:hypothetical protein
VLLQEFDDFEERSHLVAKEDGELPDFGAAQCFGGG